MDVRRFDRWNHLRVDVWRILCLLVKYWQRLRWVAANDGAAVHSGGSDRKLWSTFLGTKSAAGMGGWRRTDLLVVDWLIHDISRAALLSRVEIRFFL